ncbi:MAG: hypothetical protein OEY64_11860 [Nitrospinota bacterium]|nr:hypothetical protein [Nitrospinota bacterium]
MERELSPIVWKCTRCGHLEKCSDDRCQVLPDKCPACGAPREDLEVIEED